MSTIFTQGRFSAEDATGAPLVGGLLHTYSSGTTTPKATYSDPGLTAANTNPIALDARGEAQIWLGSGAYSMRLTDSAGVTIWTVDGITSSSALADALAVALQTDANGSGADLVAGTIRVVTSIAGLRTVGSAGRNLVLVAGYYSAGDGGGGIYRLDTSDTTTADNGGTVIVSSAGGRWKLRHHGDVSVKQFGARGNGTTDDTAAINAAVAFVVGLKQPLHFPAGTYLVTSTISLPVGSQLVGVKGDQYPDGFTIAPLATTIKFQPNVANSDLFVASGTDYSGFRFQYSIEGMFITGNANSRYALNLLGVIYGRFENLSITGFYTGINCNATINNRFVNILMACSFSNAQYAGNLETTDVWDQCTFTGPSAGGGAIIGVDFADISIGIRFSNCLFEQLNSYGMRIARGCRAIQVIGAYCEDVPYSNTATAAMFNVGYVGTSAVSDEYQLVVVGGQFSGRNAGTVGYFCDINYSNGVKIMGAVHSRFSQVFRTTSNTRVNSVVIEGGSGISWSTYANDMTRICGIYPTGVNNSGTQSQAVRVPVVSAGSISAADGNGSSIGMDGSAITFTLGAANAAYPTSDNAFDFGLDTNRWKSLRGGYLRVSSAALPGSGGTVTIGGITASTVGAAGGASAPPATPLGYVVCYVGDVQVKIPYYNA